MLLMSLLPRVICLRFRLEGDSSLGTEKTALARANWIRMLVNDEWLNRWPNFSLRGGSRTFSDHCPIFVETEKKDWGPRPFKFINSWIHHPDSDKFIKNKWEGYKIQGWTGYQLKEKLKPLKADLKDWNSAVFGNLEEQIELRRKGIEELESSWRPQKHVTL